MVLVVGEAEYDGGLWLCMSYLSGGLAEAFIWLVEILSTAVVSTLSSSVMAGPGVGLRVFSSALVVAAVPAAVWCRDWRLVPSVAAPLLAAGRVAVGVGVRPLG